MQILQEPVEPKNEIGDYTKEIGYQWSISSILEFLKNRNANIEKAYIHFHNPDREERDEGDTAYTKICYRGLRLSEEEFVKAKAQYDIDLFTYNKWKKENGALVEAFLEKERIRKNKNYEKEIENLQKRIEYYKNLIK